MFWNGLFDHFRDLIDSETDVTFVVLEWIRSFFVSRVFRWITHVVVHCAISFASDHVNLPAFRAELLANMLSITIEIRGFVSHCDRRAKRHDSQEKLVGISSLDCGYLMFE